MSRKAKVFYADRGFLTAQGATRAEAKAALEKQVDWACAHASGKIEMRFGLIIVLSATPNGWTHTIVDPADMKHGQDRHGSCLHGQIEYTDALISARHHAAQNAWNLDVADDFAFVEMAGLDNRNADELQRWINWQRSYASLISQGKSAAQAHEMASGYYRNDNPLVS